ncbi:phosphatidylinositol-specific phospholipase C [Nocardia sp. 2]|uniref:1-phosphatidylinositol phosphodiesterase n=1 Tax=Nocardia acididurans TaxID=2802282 RepID=A0ABS1M617_9NOCA|nr:phosphatidylinositol-specific phospholipase C [Nocardia acididurans]MBL1075234.1 phosphatidylinositol-specific phospholipase C [Nocardia acididurans]
MIVTRRGLFRTTLAAAALVATAAPARAVVAPHAWMSAVPDDVSLLRLTIPGTHDSCSMSPLNGTPWAQTQNWSLADQFAHGIRFLDIRCNGLQDHMADSFGIYHGPAYQGITFDAVLNACRTFLARNPGETLIMRVKKENGTANDVGADFDRIFKGYLDAKGYRPMFWIGDRIPTLGESRGRIILITQFDTTLPALHWPSGDNGTISNSTFYIQDRYQNRGLAGLESGSAGTGSTRTGSSGGDKFDHIAACFDKAAADPNNTQLYINFTSYADRAWPIDNAAAIMPRVQRYLTENQHTPAHFGIVAMDFPDRHPTVLDLLLARNHF